MRVTCACSTSPHVCSYALLSYCAHICTCIWCSTQHPFFSSSLAALYCFAYSLSLVLVYSPQCPQFKRDGDKEIPEPFAEVARFYTESRLLQRDIKVLLEGVSNQLTLGTIIHPVSCLWPIYTQCKVFWAWRDVWMCRLTWAHLCTCIRRLCEAWTKVWFHSLVPRPPHDFTRKIGKACLILVM